MDPYFMFRTVKGKLESKLFDTKVPPKGWRDTPKEVVKEVVEEVEAVVETIEVEIIEDDNSAEPDRQLSEASGDTGGQSDADGGNELGRVEPLESDDFTLAKFRR